MNAINSQIQAQLTGNMAVNQLNADQSQLNNLETKANTVLKSGTDISKEDRLAQLETVSKQFESIFMQQLLEAMDKTVMRSEDSLFNGGQAEKTFRGLLNQEMATLFSDRPGVSGFGLADSIVQQMTPLVEAAYKEPAPVNTTLNEVDG